jgi:hypothetical protein
MISSYFSAAVRLPRFGERLRLVTAYPNEPGAIKLACFQDSRQTVDHVGELWVAFHGFDQRRIKNKNWPRAIIVQEIKANWG